jgi:hypothetical protein
MSRGQWSTREMEDLEYWKSLGSFVPPEAVVEALKKLHFVLCAISGPLKYWESFPTRIVLNHSTSSFHAVAVSRVINSRPMYFSYNTWKCEVIDKIRAILLILPCFLLIKILLVVLVYFSMAQQRKAVICPPLNDASKLTCLRALFSSSPLSKSSYTLFPLH